VNVHAGFSPARVIRSTIRFLSTARANALRTRESSNGARVTLKRAK
jgi:hypothetical protein